MRKILEESGMRIPYQDDACYMIEKSPLVAKLQGVKIVEFIQSKGNKKVMMLEAKTTAPQPGNQEDYDRYLKDIREKFQNSVSLLNAARLKRREDIFKELPQSLKDVDYKKADYKLYFVIKELKDDWVTNLSDDLHLHMLPFLKCWNIRVDDLIVANEDMARKLCIVE